MWSASTAALDPISERLSVLAVELGDSIAGLREYAGRLEADPERLAAVEDRLDSLDRLKRKHGGSVESVLAHAEHCRREIERLENGEVRTAELEVALSGGGARARGSWASGLSNGRENASGPFERQLAKALEGLAMPGADPRGCVGPTPCGFRCRRS